MTWRTTNHVPTPGGWTAIQAEGSACQIVNGTQLGQRLHNVPGSASDNGLTLSNVVGVPTVESSDLYLWSPADIDPSMQLELAWFEEPVFPVIQLREQVPQAARFDLFVNQTIVVLSPGVGEVAPSPALWRNVFDCESSGDYGDLRYREFAGHVWSQVGATFSDDWDVLIWGDTGASSALQIVEVLPVQVDGATGCVRLEGVRVPPRRFGLTVRNNHSTKDARVTRVVGVVPWV